MNDTDKNMKGTTTVGFVCKDGVVLATETRATMGSLVANKNADKLFQLDDKIGATIAGTVSHAQSLMDILKAEISLYKLRNEKEMSIDSLAVLTSNILKSQPFYVQTIVGGVDKKGPKLYSMDPSGSYIEDKCISTGSGSPYALGVLEDRYNEDITVEEGKEVAIKAITSAMERDVYSGNHYRLATITEDGMKIYTREEIAQIKENM
ncbi:archaeal proteasome endopeptidase complex subunit beta [Candidatus Methanosphaera massiliense]|uniref:archaeal proteasome endopeptidase complex subunit beta n=1 Tax=Methanosphaera TaxID=2316 RepID=UPI000DC4F975|nr:archaeal proteasome endopeptidase complex subunit beta [Candidatus Methanosphaera massiliense]MDE4078244.1 archaeal proteasome endopeptidase complex subunit beta [Candidatus Methanosphaera massiliense]MDY2744176.1 archaeal proteasome endopeptidase complex subunit beta [Methanosphaera sp.]RAP44433.1 MAG: proteasome endopeptidase complex, archaeal, beta subunit [Methanosphaera sp. SHI1033]